MTPYKICDAFKLKPQAALSRKPETVPEVIKQDPPTWQSQMIEGKHNKHQIQKPFAFPR